MSNYYENESLLWPRIPYDQWCKNHIYIFRLASNFEPPKHLPFDIKRVHPIKQREVVSVYEVIRNNTNLIKEAWIIGSSVRPTCDFNSDLDLIISTDLEPHLYNIELGLCCNEISKCTQNGADIIRLENLGVNDMIYYETLTGLKII